MFFAVAWEMPAVAAVACRILLAHEGDDGECSEVLRHTEDSRDGARDRGLVGFPVMRFSYGVFEVADGEIQKPDARDKTWEEDSVSSSIETKEVFLQLFE